MLESIVITMQDNVQIINTIFNVYYFINCMGTPVYNLTTTRIVSYHHHELGNVVIQARD